MHIRDSVFIVTGAASGLGAATATLLVEQGGKVILADLNDATGKALAGQLGANARYTQTNVADESSGQAAIDTALEEFGALHGLVNCAGIAPSGKLVGKNRQGIASTVSSRPHSTSILSAPSTCAVWPLMPCATRPRTLKVSAACS